MTENPPSIDRHERLKLANRRAIIEATIMLIDEHGIAALNADTLAERAGVSRRTIFNHFSSIDEIIPEAFSGTLQDVMDRGAATASALQSEGEPPSLLDELALTVREPGFLREISVLVRVICSVAESDPGKLQWIDEAMRTVTTHMIGQIPARHPELDPFDVALLATLVAHSLGVAAQRWHELTGARADADSQAVWSQLVDHALSFVRDGFTAATRPVPTVSEE